MMIKPVMGQRLRYGFEMILRSRKGTAVINDDWVGGRFTVIDAKIS
ncbi:MAG: hypothetical protein AAGC93_13845 [Cyanobacteria bacterium P01_F01_bin.53]